ncbi:aldo/keto reductase [Irpex rosettiformis]|uniref:Aldo/keto reductase n=1 Tax=Irpex rosettiformis TaxID=378272 RepID=A0ACB8TW89_9APHY|nr:aldo/keto reductase [Irpex rosettiformis]
MSTLKTFTTLGGTASNVKVARVAHGLMLMTWTPHPVPDEQCFEAIKAGIDLCPPGVKMMLNSGEFYAHDFGTANLEMLSRFFEKYPEYADRCFLSVKGGKVPGKFDFDASVEGIKRSVNTCNEALRHKKHIDLFELARVDTSRPIEEAIRNLKTIIDEGLFDHIGLSEVNADTLRRANAVYPITAVEIEVSPWSMEEETKKVLATATELGVTVAAYAPLGRGFLTGKFKSIDDIPKDDMRSHHTRFKDPEIFAYNLQLVDKLKAIAEKKDVTAAQLSIAWVAALHPTLVLPLAGSSHPKRTIENALAGDIELSEEEKKQVWDIIDTFGFKGDRYDGRPPEQLRLWG